MSPNKCRVKNILALTLIMSFTGCVHYIMRGTVVEKESDDEVQVCLGNREVKAGDRVTLFKIVCTGPIAVKPGVGVCSKDRIGEGVVTRTLSEHMSIVKVDPGVELKGSTVVEVEKK